MWISRSVLKRFSKMSQQSDDISRLIQTSKNTLASSSKLVARLMEGNERREQLKTFENLMEDLCTLSEGHKNVCAALEDVKKTARRASGGGKKDGEHDGDLHALYESKLEALQAGGGAADVAQHPDMMAFRTMLREVLSDEYGATEDEDVVLTAAEVNIHDPFTRQVMVDPVKNVKCGHRYERATIEAVIQQRPTKCPCLSCPNRTEIRLLDLEPDERLRSYLQTLRESAPSCDTSVNSLDDTEIV